MIQIIYAKYLCTITNSLGTDKKSIQRFLNLFLIFITEAFKTLLTATSFSYFQARVHDESLRYVLSDQAIVTLADKVPTTQEEICTLISQADLNVDSMSSSSALPSPSPVVCSHLEDFNYLFHDKMAKLDNIFLEILQNHLGPDGSCPLSVFNYAILSKTNLNLTNRLVSKQNGHKNSKQVGQKKSRQQFVKKFSCKSPVYHNCRIFASDGRLLCYCDRRKLEWSVSLPFTFV